MMLFNSINSFLFISRFSSWQIRYLVFILIFIFASPSSFSQEFEITLPDDYKPKRYIQKGKSSQSSSHIKVSSEKIDTNLELLGKAELYLFSKTSDGLSERRRLEILEKVLYGQIGKGSLKERSEKVFKTISSGNVCVKEGMIPEKIERHNDKKWWHFGSKKRANEDFKLVKYGRKFYKSGNWDKAKDKFEQVLMIEPANIEAIFTVAVCEFQLCSNPNESKPSYMIDERLVVARERLVTAKRLFVLSGNTKQALEASKFIDKIDNRRQEFAGPIKEF